MYPRIVKVAIIIPWQPPQTILVRELTRGIYRTTLIDQFERKINYAGTDIGFGVSLFKSTVNQSYIVVKGLWDQAIYKAPNKQPVQLTILDIATDDE